MIDLRGIAAAGLGIAFDHRIHRGVSHAFGGADHAFVDFIANDFAAMVDLHRAREHEAIHLRAQAANVGGKLERQHGHSAVGKIDAGAAQTRFLSRAELGRDVVGYVGDVDLQFVVAGLELANVDGIVEVAGGFAINRDDGEVAVVASAVQIQKRG